MFLSYADSLKNSISQRIGNYNMEMKTDPINPIAGQNTNVLLRISNIDGEDLIELIFIIIKISKAGTELESAPHPILVPYGHYTYSYVFSEAGIYALQVEITDNYYYAYPGQQNITFTFPISVSSFYAADFSLYTIISIIIVVIVIVLVLLIFQKRKKNKREKMSSKRSIEGMKY
jgi:hypothetical protein